MRKEHAVACRRCEERGQTWMGSPPVCAFRHVDGESRQDMAQRNWNCATMNALRDKIAENHHQTFYSNDQVLGVLPVGASFLVLCWYKRRGAVDAAVVLDDEGFQPLTLDLAEAILYDLSEEDTDDVRA